MQTILIVDDEPTQRNIIEHVLSEKLRYRAVSVSGGQEAIDWVTRKKQPMPDLILLDLSMPKVDGMKVIETLKPQFPDLPIIVLTMYGDVEKAVAAMKAGACDFLSKPVAVERLEVSLHQALQARALREEVSRLRRTNEGQLTFQDLVGMSKPFKEALAVAQKASQSSIPVLITGESGVGKELVARAIHGSSDRGGGPFVAVNCGAIPSGLAESMLFGHEKGAFTGAVQKSIGKFHEANNGTIFLDEVGELSLELQVKLLRVLQEGEVQTVGGKEVSKVNVRVISATNRDLQQRVDSGEFRGDLYYRLNVFPIPIPSLRQRKEDIEQLVQHFIKKCAALENKAVHGITSAALGMLISLPWHGNVRQLENAIFRAVVMTDHAELDISDFEAVRQDAASRPSASAHPPTAVRNSDAAILSMVDTQGHMKRIDQLEAETIKFALNYYGGHMSEVARRLGIGRSTLYRKIHDLNIVTEHNSPSQTEAA